MPSLTIAAGDLAHSIVQMRQDRAEATSGRKKRLHERSVMVASELRDVKTSRQEFTARQRRQLATFMTNLTASVGSMRDRFRTSLDGMRVTQRGELASFVTSLTADVDTLLKGFRREIRTTDKVLHQQLDAYRRDRQGASDVWSGRKPVSKPPAASPMKREAVAVSPSANVVNVEPPAKAASLTLHAPAPTPPHVAPQHQPAHGSYTPTHGGKKS